VHQAARGALREQTCCPGNQNPGHFVGIILQRTQPPQQKPTQGRCAPTHRKGPPRRRDKSYETRKAQRQAYWVRKATLGADPLSFVVNALRHLSTPMMISQRLHCQTPERSTRSPRPWPEQLGGETSRKPDMPEPVQMAFTPGSCSLAAFEHSCRSRVPDAHQATQCAKTSALLPRSP